MKMVFQPEIKQNPFPKSTVNFPNYLIQKQEILSSLHPKVILIFLFGQWEQEVTQLGGGFGIFRCNSRKSLELYLRPAFFRLACSTNDRTIPFN